MKTNVIMDTGPLVAAINCHDRHHEWARQLLGQLTPPILTCEAVLAEACYLLRETHQGASAVLALVQRGVLFSSFNLQNHIQTTMALMDKYSDIPMSLADACIVRMSEIHDKPTVATCDRDFRFYRRSGRKTIPLAAPFK